MASDIARWEPMRELGALRDEMERMVRHAFGSQPEDTALIAAWSPVLDVEETEQAFEIHVEAPGVEPEDIDVTLEEGVLTVSGERKFYEDKQQDGFRRIERRFGRFRRSLRLPAPVDSEKVEATYDAGMLTVKVPKTEAARPHKIQVHSV